MGALMTEILKTIQEGSFERPGFCLPWPYSYEPGQRLTIAHKRAGQIVRTDAWILVEYEDRGETFRRWDRVH